MKRLTPYERQIISKPREDSFAVEAVIDQPAVEHQEKIDAVAENAHETVTVNHETGDIRKNQTVKTEGGRYPKYHGPHVLVIVVA